MFKIIKVLCIVSIGHLLSTLPMTSQAAQNSASDAHKLELSISVGEIQFGADALQSVDERAKQAELSYDYSLRSGMFFGFGVLAGASGSLSIVDNIFDGDELEYQALALIGGYRVKASERHSLFAQIELLDYETNSIEKDTAQVSHGRGWAFSSGWEYRLTQSLGFSIAIERMEFADEFTVVNTRVGLRHRF